MKKENQFDFVTKNKVLYFPYINVPNNEWFLQTLLYWDEVGAIVPQEYIHDTHMMGYHMRELVHTGLVKPIRPDIYRMEAGQNFARSFIHLIEKYGLNVKARNSRFGPYYSSRIHIDKFGYEIAEYLIREKLAIRENHPWYRVEATTAGLFMSYLASFLGNSREIDMQPVSDEITTLATFSEEYAIGELNQSYFLDKMRIEVLEEILPVPRYIDDVKSIAHFKEKHGDLLINFRKKIEHKIQEISFIDDQRESNLILRNFKQSSSEEIDELVARMKEKNWGSILFGTVCSLGAAAFPATRAIIEKDIVSGLEAIPGLMGAVYAAYAGFVDKQKSILNSPYAYAAYVKREFY